MSNALAYDAMNETYHDVAKLVFDTIHRFRERYGNLAGDMDEICSEAHWHFIRAYQRYDNVRFKSSFPSYCRFLIWHELLEAMRRRMAQQRREAAVEVPEELPARPAPTFNIPDFVEGLSEDAQQVVKIALDAPKDVQLAIMIRGGETPKNLRLSIREYLKDLGWTAREITDTFLEIRRALR